MASKKQKANYPGRLNTSKPEITKLNNLPSNFLIMLSKSLSKPLQITTNIILY